jgi:S-methylmethionine-dependent homocysteine/selenocysteine methylase
VTRDDLKTWHLERMRRLAIQKVDIFAAETIPSVEEALAILDALDQVPL